MSIADDLGKALIERTVQVLVDHVEARNEVITQLRAQLAERDAWLRKKTERITELRSESVTAARSIHTLTQERDAALQRLDAALLKDAGNGPVKHTCDVSWEDVPVAALKVLDVVHRGGLGREPASRWTVTGIQFDASGAFVNYAVHVRNNATHCVDTVTCDQKRRFRRDRKTGPAL